MAVTIVQRPSANVYGSALSGRVSSSYGTTDATVYTVPTSGVANGDYIYISSNIEDYNGFWVVETTGSYTFKLKRFDTDSYASYIQDSDITYYISTYSHGWSAVHLPIVYRLSSDKFPVNSVDTSRTISSVVNDNGFVLMNISGSLGSDIKTYDSVKLTAPNQTDISGVYQIVDWISSTVVVINLTYSASYNWVSATIQRYYNNYNILVNVYGGLNSSHEWASQKPYELLSTLQLIPRAADNDAIFSINDILAKSKVKTENNLTLGTLPNNIDQFCQFYIEVAESYDKADGYSLGTYTSSYTSDQSTFEGYAVNSKLPFKNENAGFMSDYLMVGSGKFLTLFDEPVIFQDSYSDISFIISIAGTYRIDRQYYLSNVATSLLTETIDFEQGVQRYELSANCDYDRVDVTIYRENPDPVISPATGIGIYTGFAPTTYNGTPT